MHSVLDGTAGDNVGNRADGQFVLVPGVLGGSEGVVAAGAVLDESEIWLAQNYKIVRTRSKSVEFEFCLVEHVKAVQQGGEWRGVADEDARGDCFLCAGGLAFPTNLLLGDKQ